MAFGVKTNNIFDLLEDHDTENVEPSEPEPKPAAVKQKEAGKQVTQVAAGVEARLRGSANGPAGGRGRGEGRGSRGRGGRGSDRARDEGEGGEGGEGDRRSRAGRGRGGGRGADRGRRRDHDRQDGTGRGHETEKRDGAGKGNWGAVGEEDKVDQEVEEKPAEPEAPANEAAPETPAADAEPVEPEKPEMTLDEYEKLREEKRANLNKKAAAQQKADPKAFEGMKAYSRKSDEASGELELTNKKTIGRSKSGGAERTRKEKEVVPTGFRVGSDDIGRGRGGRGRGDRGFGGRRDDRPERDDRPPRRSNGDSEGPRGGRGGGFRGRGDRPSGGGRGRGREGPAPSIDDASAFPTLGGGK